MESWSGRPTQSAVVLAGDPNDHDHGASRPCRVDDGLEDIVAEALQISQLSKVWLLLLHDCNGLGFDFRGQNCQQPLFAGCDPLGC